MLGNIITYIRKISSSMYFTSSVLFISVIGLLPLFGYLIAVAQERILNGVHTEPPSVSSLYSLTIKGLIGLSILFLTLVPSGIIYVLLPILMDMIEVGESLFLSLFLLIISILGLIFSLAGLYLFSAFLFAYCRYSVDERLDLKDAVLYTLFQVSISKKYFKSFIWIVVLSLLFGLMTELLFLSILLFPTVGVFALIYISIIGYIIGSLTTEFRTVQDLPFNLSPEEEIKHILDKYVQN